MKCPKCQAEQTEYNTICTDCDIVFEKYYKYHPSASNKSVESNETKTIVYDCKIKPSIKELLFQVPDNSEPVIIIVKSIVLMVFFIWGWTLIWPSIESNAVAASFMHSINLPFHEAGHVIFKIFGSFMASLGGTLGQLLMPIICLFVLLIKTRDAFGASICLWWLGENFLDIAPYINDARAGELPLLGGNFGHSAPYGFHDWQYLLTETGLINSDQTIAKFSFFIGTLLMMTAFIWGALLLIKQFRKI